MIAVAATLVGCSREPPRQAITKSCADERQLGCSNRTAARLPIKLASSFKADSPTGTKLRTEGPPLHRARDRTARLVTKKAKPTFITAKTEPSANRMLLPPPSLNTRLEPKDGVATAGSGTPEQPTVGLAPNSNSRTMQEQVAAAIAVAKRRTVAALPAARDLEPVEGRPPNKKEGLVAVVMTRPEIRSVSDLEGKDVAMDEEYSESRNDILVAFVVAGALPDQFSAGQTTAINRLLSGEVPAAVLALVSPDAAEGFPDVAGFKVFQIPLLPR
jgi:hypothetical protein